MITSAPRLTVRRFSCAKAVNPDFGILAASRDIFPITGNHNQLHDFLPITGGVTLAGRWAGALYIMGR
jgi:hypothetical protein